MANALFRESPRGCCSLSDKASDSTTPHKSPVKKKPRIIKATSGSHITAADMFPMSSEMKITMEALGKLDLTPQMQEKKSDEHATRVRIRHKGTLRDGGVASQGTLHSQFSSPRLSTQPSCAATKRRIGALPKLKSSHSRGPLTRAHTVDFLPLPRVEVKARSHTIDVVTPDMKLDYLPPGGQAFVSREFEDVESERSSLASRGNWPKGNHRRIVRAGSAGRVTEYEKISLDYSTKHTPNGKQLNRTAWETMQKNRQELLDKWLPS